MSRKRDLADLAAILDAAHRADVAALARARRRADDLRARADALSGPVSPGDGVASALAAERHGIWRRERRAALNAELAWALADREVARDRARRSFGRAQAAAALARGGR